MNPYDGDIRSWGCYYEAIKDVTLGDVIEYPEEPEEDENGEEEE